MDSKASYDGNIQTTDPGMAELGIGLVPPVHQTQQPVQLFFVWCAANIGILGVVYGAVIVAFGLSFWQSILAAVAGVASLRWSASPASPAKSAAPRRSPSPGSFLANAAISRPPASVG